MILKNTQTISLNNKNFTFQIRDDADESVLNEIFKWREYRSAEPIIKESKTILDIGAHAGFFAAYCRTLNPNTDIICLEPEQNNFIALKNHIKTNHLNIKAKNLALATKTGEGLLKVSEDSHNHHLIEDENDTTQKVQTISLNDLVKNQQIDLLKMDIEGAEFKIIQSWTKEDWAKIKNIIMEVHDIPTTRQSLEQIIRQAGFGVQFFPCQFDNTLGFILATNKKTT